MYIRKAKGYSTLEMVCATLFFIPVFLCLIDVYFLVMGYWWSISHCSLAARSASEGPPNAIAMRAPQNRAEQVLATEDNSSIRVDECNVSELLTALPDPVAGGPVTGSVTVAIKVSVTPPFLLKFVFPGKKFTINTSQTCPYTWEQRGPITN